jgi:hypothetical protein
MRFSERALVIPALASLTFARERACGHETASLIVTEKGNLVAKFRSFRDDSGRDRFDRKTSTHLLRMTAEHLGGFG